ncbi:MAG TPA: DUF4105 domain-containing protein [Candidatus Wallbacteria bacterium]|nr:DUF4105 domain-containing protein [Candidatus Wallbacteria bacterium]
MKNIVTKRVSIFFTAVLVLSFAFSTQAFSQQNEWNTKQRPAVLAEPEANGIYKISNVRWGFDEPCTVETLNPKWRTTTIDVNKIKDVIFIVKPFPPEWLAAHCLFFFEFESPIVTEFGERSNGLVMSIEARLLKGQAYSLLKGNFGAFFIVYQLGCREDYIQYSSIEKKTLIPYKLKLTKEQKVELLKCAIGESLENRDNEKYNTINNSCTNNLFLLLNKVLPKEQQFKEWILKKVIYNLGISFPRTAGKILKKHDLIETSLPMIKPDPANRGDIATKELAGAELNAARAKAAKLEAKADSVNGIIKDAVCAGNISKDLLKTLLYNEEAEQVIGLHVPGTVIGEKNNGEFFIGKDFSDKLDSIALTNDIANFMDEVFAAYKAAVVKRMTLEGPDAEKFIDSQLDSLNKSIQQAVKYSELNQRN